MKRQITAHTPPPWEWIASSNEIAHRLVHFLPGETFQNGEPKFELIIDDGSACGEYSPSIEVHSPNGKLIAAAPELLAAAKLAMDRLAWLIMDCAEDELAGHIAAHDALRDAIIKAGAEPNTLPEPA